eukprot:1519016-Amphidinium_carterae.1
MFVKKGLKPLQADPNMVQLAKPVVVSKDGTTHHLPPFLVETMTEDQVRMFLKTKDPMVLIEDDADDEAAYRAAAASTSNSEDSDASPRDYDASSSEESLRSEESPDVPEVLETVDSSTTTVVTTSEDLEKNYPLEQFYD